MESADPKPVVLKADYDALHVQIVNMQETIDRQADALVAKDQAYDELKRRFDHLITSYRGNIMGQDA